MYNFYWDSCNRNTIITYDYVYDYPFFEQLISEEVSSLEKRQVCLNVEKYLKKTTKGLEQIESCMINGVFLEVWNYISDWNKVFPDCDDIKITAVYTGDCRFLGTTVDIYAVENNILLGSLVVKNVLMSEDKMELILESVRKENLIIPRQTVYIRLTRIGNEMCFFSIIHIVNEYIAEDILFIISKLKKKILKSIKDKYDNLRKKRHQ